MSGRDYDKELESLKEKIINITGEDELQRIKYVGNFFSQSQVNVKCSVIQEFIG